MSEEALSELSFDENEEDEFLKERMWVHKRTLHSQNSIGKGTYWKIGSSQKGRTLWYLANTSKMRRLSLINRESKCI